MDKPLITLCVWKVQSGNPPRKKPWVLVIDTCAEIAREIPETQCRTKKEIMALFRQVKKEMQTGNKGAREKIDDAACGIRQIIRRMIAKNTVF